MPNEIRWTCRAAARFRTANRLARLLLETLLVLFAAAAATNGQTVSGQNDAKLSSAVEVPTTDGTVYKVSFEYAFRDRNTVYIDGVGTVPAHGRLGYLTSGNSIRFLDSFGGKPLYIIPIVDPVQMMGSEATDLPKETAFPEGYRQGTWISEKPFAIAALEVLDRFFPNGYRAYKRAERQFFLTTFAMLPPLDDRLTAKVAVLVSSPADADPRNLRFTLQFVARERRSHTEWRENLGDKAQGAVQNYVSDILKGLQSSGK